jgi:hypothetical protein
MFKITYQVRTFYEMQQMGWEEWQQAMQTAKGIVMKYRQMLANAKLQTDEAARKKSKQAADAVKRTLPGACFQASDFAVSIGDDPKKKYNYQKAGRWRDMRYAYLSGLVVIDVDHCGNPRELFVRLQQEHDFKALGILLVYVSASEDGMKIVFKADPDYPHNLICQQWAMAERLGVLQWVDDQCKDSTRLSFLTTPDDVLYCDEKELFNR